MGSWSASSSHPRPAQGPWVVAGGARATCCCSQELLLRANMEEMRCAVPRSRGEPLVQVMPSPPCPGPVLMVAFSHVREESPQRHVSVEPFPASPGRPGSPCRWDVLLKPG